MSAFTPEDLWALPRVGAPSCDPAGRAVVVPVTTHDDEDGSPLTRLWLVDEQGPRALTSAATSSRSPVVSPDGRTLAFVRDVDDTPQAHVLRLDGGEATAVTELPLGVVGSPTWLPDGSGLLVVARVPREDPTPAGARAHLEEVEDRRHDAHVTELQTYRHWHTWLTEPLTAHVLHVELATGAIRDLTPEADQRLGWFPSEDPGSHVAVSADGARFAWCGAELVDGAKQQLWVGLLDDPVAARSLTPDTEVHVGSPVFLRDGRVVVRVPRAPAPYAAPADLVAFAPDGDRQDVALDAVAWDHQPTSHRVTDGDRLLVTTEHHGRGRLVLVDPSDGTVEELAHERSLGPAVPYGDGAVAVQSGIDLPPRLVRVTGDDVVELWAPAALPDDTDLGRLEERWVAAGHGDEVQVLLLHPPADAVADDLPSLVHLIHGGPHGTFGDTWHWRWCAATVAARGHLVAMVNFHGSTSFGHDFTTSITGDWASLPTADVEAATDALVTDGLVDPDRMAITGGSYGGYLTTWLATQTDRYRCAVAHAAVTDLAAMYATDVVEDLATAAGATPWEDLDRVQVASPSAHYADYVTPTLVVHGANDHRVPIDQGLALYGVLKAKGVEARLVHYPGEHHWVLGKHNSLHWYAEFLDWLDRFLA